MVSRVTTLQKELILALLDSGLTKEELVSEINRIADERCSKLTTLKREDDLRNGSCQTSSTGIITPLVKEGQLDTPCESDYPEFPGGPLSSELLRLDVLL